MVTSIASPIVYSPIPSNTRIVTTSNSSSSSIRCPRSTNNGHGRGPVGVSLLQKKSIRRRRFSCNCSTTPGGPTPGENESKQVLDAFFLGKAFAEALNERIESTVGEFLSTVGRLQAEQQKQVQEFQDEVVERAKKAKEKAAREAMEAQGLVSRNANANASINVVSAAIDEPASSSSSSSSSTGSNDGNPTDPLLGISIDD